MIEIERLTLSYGRAGQKALDEISLIVPDGEFVALVGASGSGKTSLLKTINRLHEPTDGTVRLDGEDVSQIAAPLLRRRIGYAFQGIGLFPHMSIAENIGITPALLGWSREDIAARVAELLALMDLPAEFAERHPSMLSGGQQQRVGVARALAARPKVMLMDEPFGALDPLTRDALGQTYRALHADLGLTTIMVTHDIQEAILLADRIVVMAKGRVIADGSPAQLSGDSAPKPVFDLMNVPRQQAERVQTILSGRAHV